MFGDDRPRRRVVYGRNSTEDQVEKGTIENQVNYLRTRAQLEGWDLVGFYLDEGVSGTVPLPERPAGRRLVEDARGGVFDEVILYRLDRLGRTVRVLLEAHDLLKATGVTIRSATEPFDTHSPIGEFVFQLLGSIAQLERATILERTQMGRERVVRSHRRWVCGRIPYGYDADENRSLVPSEHLVEAIGCTEADLIRQIFDRLAAGESTRQVALWINDLAIPRVHRYPNGRVKVTSDPWSPTLIWQIAQNDIYLGEGQITTKQGPIPYTCQPLVGRSTRDQAREALHRGKIYQRKYVTRPWLLNGLITCGNCGGRYIGITHHDPETRYYYYACTHQNKKPWRGERCKAKQIRALDIEKRVEDYCRYWLAHPTELLHHAYEALTKRQAEAENLEPQRLALQGQIVEKEREKERVLALYRRGRITIDEADEQLDEIGRERVALQARLDALRSRDDLASLLSARIRAEEEMLRDLGLEWDALSFDEKRQAVRSALVRIDVHTEGDGRQKRARIALVPTFPDIPISSDVYAEAYALLMRKMGGAA